MKIILNQDVPNLGEEGDVCVVKDGYARNYLLPTGAAVICNNANLSIFKSRAAAIEKRKIAKREASASLKARLDNVTLTIVVAAGESGKLFGSVTPMMIQEELAKQGFEIERKRIEVATHSIKMTGNYTARIHLYENESSEIKLVVKSEAEVKAEERAAAKAAEEAAKAAEKAAREAAEKEAAEKAAAEEAARLEAESNTALEEAVLAEHEAKEAEEAAKEALKEAVEAEKEQADNADILEYKASDALNDAVEAEAAAKEAEAAAEEVLTETVEAEKAEN